MTDAHTATLTHYCKYPSCTREVSSPVGRYSYCEEHRGQAAPRTATKRKLSGLAAELRSLTALAKSADAAEAKARKLTEKALAAKRDADMKREEFRARAAALIASKDEAA